jgi:hypothetical protein
MRTSVPHDVLHSSVAQVLGAVEHRTRAMPHLRPAINRVMREALSHAVIGGSCDMEGDEPRMWLTEAADRLGFNREGFYSLVHAVGEGKSPKKRRLKITEDQFRILAGHAATLMTRREVGDALGLLSWEVRHLEAGGYLRAVSKVARGSASGACYLRRDVDRILEHIEALATGSSGGQTVRGYARQNGLPGGQVAVAILDGELLAFKNAGGPRGFGGIRVTALGYLRRKTQNAPGRTLSVAEACALTNLGYGKVVSMLRAGSFSSGDRSGMLDCEAVENFARRYRPVSELAVPLGLSPDVLVKRLRLAGVSFVGTEFWVAAVADKAQAMRALDLDADPTIIVDGDFDEFWERLSTAARIACPQYKLPPYLPAAGQQVWRGDRKVSVSLRYRADKKEIEARVASGNLGGCTDVAISVPISDGPDALVGFLVTAAERERHTRFPPGSADATTPMTAIPNNEVPR